MTRHAFAAAMRRAITNAGFVNVRMTYLHRGMHGPMHRAVAQCPCGHHSGFIIYDQGQDAYSAAQKAARDHIALDRVEGKLPKV